MQELCTDHQFVKFTWSDVDFDKEITQQFQVNSVPFIILLHPNRDDGEKIAYPQRSTVLEVVQSYNVHYTHAFLEEKKKAFKNIENLLSHMPVTVFMRGTPTQPECKASQILVEYFMKMEIRYRPYDILKDSTIKEWVKQYSQWPTFPQVFVNGKFLGGSEMIIDMIESDEFLSIIPQEAIKTNALERIKGALGKSIVVIFLKGTPMKPNDGY